MAHADDLPLADYDQLSLGDLRGRIRSLEEGQLRMLFDHESAHGNRIPVLEVLHARLNELHHGAEPSPGDQSKVPGIEPTPGGSRVQETTAAEPGSRLRHMPSKGRHGR